MKIGPRTTKRWDVAPWPPAVLWQRFGTWYRSSVPWRRAPMDLDWIPVMDWPPLIYGDHYESITGVRYYLDSRTETWQPVNESSNP